MLLTKDTKLFNSNIDAPPSKSIYHRELIVRMLIGDVSHLDILDDDNEDIIATKTCLRNLYEAKRNNQTEVLLPCNESGSTLRFMMPVAAAYLLYDEAGTEGKLDVASQGEVEAGTEGKKDATSQGEVEAGTTGKLDAASQGEVEAGGIRIIMSTKGRLFDRPIGILKEALNAHGINVTEDAGSRSYIITGKMTPGEYVIDGSVSSQYISGLLMALTYMKEKCTIRITGELKSVHYIKLTEAALEKYGCPVGFKDMVYYPTAGYPDETLGEFKVEGDWSNGAFLLCLKRWTDITVGNLNPESLQGDAAILHFLEEIDKASPEDELTFKCSDIPDIVPYMAITAAFSVRKATFDGVARLRIKESDRVKAVREMLEAVNVRTEETEDTLTVYGYEGKKKFGDETFPKKKFGDESSLEKKEGDEGKDMPVRLSSSHDHRMAMCAILIAAILKTDVELDEAECLRKSFPQLLEYL